MVRLKHLGQIPVPPHYSVMLEENNYAELVFAGEEDEALILCEMLDAGVTVRGFTVTKASLEGTLLHIDGTRTWRSNVRWRGI